MAKVIQSDPAMSAKVLQLANSAFFGLAQRVGSISQAVSSSASPTPGAFLLSSWGIPFSAELPGWRKMTERDLESMSHGK